LTGRTDTSPLRTSLLRSGLSNSGLCGTIPVGLRQPDDGALPACPQSFITCGVNNDAIVCRALGDLYYATNGVYWTSKTGWSTAAAGTATDYCTFFGATCSNGVLNQLCVCHAAGRHSTVLRRPAYALSNLAGNQLSGTIPTSLGSLTGLQDLCVRCIRISRAQC